MTRFKGERAKSFLDSIPTSSLDSDVDTLTEGCKFNFRYFTKQDHSQDFQEWTAEKLCSLLSKLKDFSNFSLDHWAMQPCGRKKSRVFSVYDSFPPKSKMSHPKAVPHQALWARFRLDYETRLIGFVLPNSYDGKYHKVTGKPWDCNTFYVVFLDENHSFWGD